MSKRPRISVNSQFFNQWSSEMAYVLGVICADGCLVEHANGYHTLNITSKDLDWLQRLKQTLQAGQKICSKERGYQLQIRNQPIYRRLLDLGLTPRKSKTLRLPSVPSAVFGDFVRGYFDGDGSVNLYQEKRWRRSWRLRTMFVSGSVEFLEALRNRLAVEAHLGRGSVWYGTRAYCLQYMTADSLRLAAFMYRGHDDCLCLARKRDRFEHFQTLRSAFILTIGRSFATVGA